MSIDDVAVDLETIARLKKRLEALTKVKDDLLLSNKEQQSEISSLKAAIRELAHERDCITLELRDLRAELDKQLS